MPNLENLKKRAKTLVKQHRAAHIPVATRLRRGHPPFAALSDKMILAARFALVDALEVVAREEGFASWADAAGASATSATSKPEAPPPATSGEPRLVAAYPQALVADVSRAVAFYRDDLGFAVVYLYGEPPFYGLVERGGARINLRHVHAPARYRGARAGEADADGGGDADEDVLTANIPVENVKALFLELQARGVAFAQTLKEQPWGARDFLVRDPDGNLLCFASTLETS